jgi:hypothetical protein
MRVRECLLTHTLAFHKNQGLQQQVILPGLALHVVNHIGQLHVGIESKNRHIERSELASRLIASGKSRKPPPDAD